MEVNFPPASMLSNSTNAILEEMEQLNNNEMSSAAQRRIVLTFNSSYKLGIKALSKYSNFLTPKQVAGFLYNTQGISKVKLGELFGDSYPQYQEILKCYLDWMYFALYDIDHALRFFLSKFILPKEQPKLDRILAHFAGLPLFTTELTLTEKYCKDNPDSFLDVENSQQLSSAILALNASLHSENAKKMTKDAFLQYCVHIATPSPFLEKIYQRISKFEIKLNSEDTLFDTAELQGYLIKEGGSVKTWKKRWFVLQDHSLYYFSCPGDAKPIGIIPLEGCTVRVAEPIKKDATKQLAFVLEPKNGTIMKAFKVSKYTRKVVEGKHTNYTVACHNKEELASWISAIQGCIHNLNNK